MSSTQHEPCYYNRSRRVFKRCKHARVRIWLDSGGERWRQKNILYSTKYISSARSRELLCIARGALCLLGIDDVYIVLYSKYTPPYTDNVCQKRMIGTNRDLCVIWKWLCFMNMSLVIWTTTQCFVHMHYQVIWVDIQIYPNGKIHSGGPHYMTSTFVHTFVIAPSNIYIYDILYLRAA